MRRSGVLGAGAAIVVVASLVWARHTPKAPPPPQPDFTLTAPDGHSVSLHELHGRWVLVYFGYTHCRGACTTPLAGMKQAAGSRQDVSALFVTLDPERDNGEALAAFTRPFDPPVTGLTGSTAAIEAAEQAFGVYVVKRDTPHGPHYDRSNAIYVVDPAGRLVGHVDGGAPAGIIASSIGKPAA